MSIAPYAEEVLQRFRASARRLPLPDKDSVVEYFNRGGEVTWPAARISARLKHLLLSPGTSGFVSLDLRRIARAVRLQSVLGGTDRWAAEIEKVAGHVGGGIPIRVPSEPEWDEIADLGRGLLILEGENIPQPELRDPRLHALSSAARRLLATGVSMTVEDGTLVMDDEALRIVTAQIRAHLAKLGLEDALSRLFHAMTKDLGCRDDIYLVGRRTHPGRTQASIPYALLLQLAVTVPAQPPTSGSGAAWNRAVTLASDLASILDIEPFAVLESVLAQATRTVAHFGDLALFDALFTLRQWRRSDAHPILASFFDGIDEASMEAKLGWSIADALLLLRAVSSISEADPPLMRREELVYAGVDPDRLPSLLASFVHPAGSANQSVGSPLDQPDLMFRPLVEVGDGLFTAVARSLMGPAFYEVIQGGVRDALGKKFADDLAGDGTERVTRRLFERAGLSPSIANDKYDMAGFGDGECDLVYESEETILFVETKGKAITRATMTGISGSALLDLAGGMLSAQLQGLHHERVLRERGDLRFKSGRSLPLGGRNVVTLSVTLLDHGSLQDRILLHTLLEQLLNLTYTVSVGLGKASQVDKLNEIAAKGREDVKRLMALGIDPLRRPASRASMGAGLLALVMDDVATSNAASALDEFIRRAAVLSSYGTMNPTTEYLLAHPRP